ncbi:hypothetical protein GQ42DRAFT_154729 [Ramicandelaber brevisporus]|nr:hypothetical protein GQ42DRAFT_154729 [Ramicandelaber brevisporus]
MAIRLGCVLNTPIEAGLLCMGCSPARSTYIPDDCGCDPVCERCTNCDSFIVLPSLPQLHKYTKHTLVDTRPSLTIMNQQQQQQQQQQQHEDGEQQSTSVSTITTTTTTATTTTTTTTTTTEEESEAENTNGMTGEVRQTVSATTTTTAATTVTIAAAPTSIAATLQQSSTTCTAVESSQSEPTSNNTPVVDVDAADAGYDANDNEEEEEDDDDNNNDADNDADYSDTDDASSDIDSIIPDRVDHNDEYDDGHEADLEDYDSSSIDGDSDDNSDCDDNIDTASSMSTVSSHESTSSRQSGTIKQLRVKLQKIGEVIHQCPSSDSESSSYTSDSEIELDPVEPATTAEHITDVDIITSTAVTAAETAAATEESANEAKNTDPEAGKAMIAKAMEYAKTRDNIPPRELDMTDEEYARFIIEYTNKRYCDKRLAEHFRKNPILPDLPPQQYYESVLEFSVPVSKTSFVMSPNLHSFNGNDKVSKQAASMAQRAGVKYLPKAVMSLNVLLMALQEAADAHVNKSAPLHREYKFVNEILPPVGNYNSPIPYPMDWWFALPNRLMVKFKFINVLANQLQMPNFVNSFQMVEGRIYRYLLSLDIAEEYAAKITEHELLVDSAYLATQRDQGVSFIRQSFVRFHDKMKANAQSTVSSSLSSSSTTTATAASEQTNTESSTGQQQQHQQQQRESSSSTTSSSEVSNGLLGRIADAIPRVASLGTRLFGVGSDRVRSSHPHSYTAPPGDMSQSLPVGHSGHASSLSPHSLHSPHRRSSCYADLQPGDYFTVTRGFGIEAKIPILPKQMPELTAIIAGESLEGLHALMPSSPHRHQDDRMRHGFSSQSVPQSTVNRDAVTYQTRSRSSTMDIPPAASSAHQSGKAGTNGNTSMLSIATGSTARSAHRSLSVVNTSSPTVSSPQPGFLQRVSSLISTGISTFTSDNRTPSPPSSNPVPPSSQQQQQQQQQQHQEQYSNQISAMRSPGYGKLNGNHRAMSSHSPPYSWNNSDSRRRASLDRQNGGPITSTTGIHQLHYQMLSVNYPRSPMRRDSRQSYQHPSGPDSGYDVTTAATTTATTTASQ